MQYEICFLDRHGRLSCLMAGHFSDHNHAASFAQHAMDTAASRGKLRSAEIHGNGQRLAVMISPYVQKTRQTLKERRVQAIVARNCRGFAELLHAVRLPESRAMNSQVEQCLAHARTAEDHAKSAIEGHIRENWLGIANSYRQLAQVKLQRSFPCSATENGPASDAEASF